MKFTWTKMHPVLESGKPILTTLPFRGQPTKKTEGRKTDLVSVTNRKLVQNQGVSVKRSFRKKDLSKNQGV
jgi:hypothetical protein